MTNIKQFQRIKSSLICDTKLHMSTNNASQWINPFFFKILPLAYDDYHKYGLDTNEYLKVSVAQRLDPSIWSERIKIQIILPFLFLS
jgi:hypothetical protein